MQKVGQSHEEEIPQAMTKNIYNRC